MAIDITEMRPEHAQAVIELLERTQGQGDAAEHGVAVKDAADVERMVRRFPCLSVVAWDEGKLVGAMLFVRGSDGREAHLVAVDESADQVELPHMLAGRAVGKMAGRSMRLCRIGIASTLDAEGFWHAAQWHAPPAFDHGQEGQYRPAAAQSVAQIASGSNESAAADATPDNAASPVEGDEASATSSDAADETPAAHAA